MSLIKDGKVYRTPEEQLLHLTEKHLEQVVLNENISKKIQELTVASNLGGYNIVRNAFSLKNSFHIKTVVIPEDLDDAFCNSFVTLETFNYADIPAYGFIDKSKKINIIFYGDYVENFSELKLISRNNFVRITIPVEMEYGEATSLIKLDANLYKKQVFTVLDDLDYGCSTQYVSYDINNDGRYEFVYIGPNKNGKDGKSVYTANDEDYEFVRSSLKIGDILVCASSIQSTINHQTKEMGSNAGDVLEFISGNEFVFKGSIIGATGEKGQKGDRGPQGLQGIQGVQGIQGEKGEQGEKGKDGVYLNIKSGILRDASELPQFNLANVGDAYRIMNLSGTYVSYDLYFKTSDGVDWDIQPNWGGVKGEKGDKGDRGLQGIQGPAGPTKHTHFVSFYFSKNGKQPLIRARFISDKETAYTYEEFWDYVYYSKMPIDLFFSDSSTVASLHPVNGYSYLLLKELYIHKAPEIDYGYDLRVRNLCEMYRQDINRVTDFVSYVD